MNPYLPFATGLVLVTCLSACMGPSGPVHTGAGFVQTTSCHRDDWASIYVTQVTPSNRIPLVGPGWVSCYPDPDPFEPAKTSSYSSDTRELPEWIDFSFVVFEKGEEKKLTNVQVYARIDNERGITQRVYVRRQIPQSVLDAVAESRRHQDENVPFLYLQVYFIWTKEGIQLTWAENKSQPVGPPNIYLYGGYVPKEMKASIVEYLHTVHARYYGPSPQAPSAPKGSNE